MAKQSFNHFQALAHTLPGICKQIVTETAKQGKANVQEEIVAKDAVDTGFMLNSVYTMTIDGTDYQGGDKALPAVDKPESETEAYYAVAAKYAQFVNNGTRFVAPRPFFDQGSEKTRQQFEQAMATIPSKLQDIVQ